MLKQAATCLLLLGLAALAASCKGDSPPPPRIEVTLKEWQIGATPVEVKPGYVLFDVQNQGTRKHELVIIKSDLPPGQLPTTAENTVDLSKFNVALELAAVDANATTNVIGADLFPGKYILLCNLIDKPATGPADPHYANGMATPLLVLDK